MCVSICKLNKYNIYVIYYHDISQESLSFLALDPLLASPQAPQA